ncbi:response regulator [Sulfurimonas sp.]|uniref:response regulator n=1 Tax=Sulfurimonas sp. TaxID=2022749 RepID=UPI0025D06274|nr:response regulator [Sulfurimonas sp.]
MTVSEFKKISKKINVLYVEDSVTTQLIIKELLSEYFSEIDVCHNGKEGLELYKEYEYDLVITDIIMPHMDGIAMIKEIRKINKFQNIVVISASEDSKDLIPLINQGIDRIIPKPVNSKYLITVLAKVCLEITTRIENEQLKNSLNEKNEEMRAIFNNTDNAIFIVENSTLVLANLQALSLTLNGTEEELQDILSNLDKYLLNEPGYSYATSVVELVNEILTSNEETKKIKLIVNNNEKIFTYSIYEFAKEGKYAFYLYDITTYSQSIHLNPFTRLPNSLDIREKIEEKCKETTPFSVVLMSIYNSEAIQHWHGGDSCTKAEIKIANIFKYQLSLLEVEYYFANLAKNSFVIIVEKDVESLIEFLISQQDKISIFKENSSSKNQEIILELKAKSLAFKNNNVTDVMNSIEEEFTKIVS